MIARRVVRGQTLSFPSAEPSAGMRRAAPSPSGATAASCGQVPTAVCRRATAALPSMTIGDCLVMPGFIDAHIHFPQYRMLAAPGRDLLDWLRRFTFPEEARYADATHAGHAAGMLSRSPVRQRHDLGARLLLGPQGLRRSAVSRRRNGAQHGDRHRQDDDGPQRRCPRSRTIRSRGRARARSFWPNGTAAGAPAMR